MGLGAGMLANIPLSALAHASFNGFVQSFFGESFDADHAWFWIGDYGILTLIPYVVLAGWLYWSGRVDAALQAAGLDRSPRPLTQDLL